MDRLIVLSAAHRAHVRLLVDGYLDDARLRNALVKRFDLSAQGTLELVRKDGARLAAHLRVLT